MVLLKRVVITAAAVCVLNGLPGTAAAGPSMLDGTIWAAVAADAPCKIDPLLLYSISLVESRKGAGNGTVRPHPYALRNSVSGSVYPVNFEDAKKELERYLQEDRLTDIGVMQINYRWNGNRVEQPVELLNIKTNISVGADILCESLKAFPEDIRLGVGGYHTRNPERKEDAIRYGENVLLIWKRLSRGNS